MVENTYIHEAKGIHFGSYLHLCPGARGGGKFGKSTTTTKVTVHKHQDIVGIELFWNVILSLVSTVSEHPTLTPVAFINLEGNRDRFSFIKGIDA
jgi:hypothetical protein